MRRLIRPACTRLRYLLLFALLAALCGCSTKYVWSNPAKSDLAFKQDLFTCEGKAAEFSRNMGKAGNQGFFDEHLSRCMESLHYKWVPEESVAAVLIAKSAAPLASGFPACAGSDAAWCSPCWANPENTWCCTHRKSSGFPDCGKDQSTCPYCEGCYKNGSCANLCTKPVGGDPTNIRITNQTDKDVTIAFVTAAAGSACKGIDKMISYRWIAEHTTWCKNPTQEGGDANAGYCTGTVPKGGFVEVVRTGDDARKCLSGSILMGGKLSCPTPAGFTQGEFTLNPTDTSTEAIDISLVNGANYALSVNLPGEAWAVQDGGANVRSIGPSEGLSGNNNKNGIFPPGCTDCVRAVEGRIPCPSITPNPQCQQSRICNIYRGGVTGGTVEFVIVKDLQK